MKRDEGKKSILEILRESGAITAEQFAAAVKAASSGATDPLAALVEKCGVPSETVMSALRGLDEGYDFLDFLSARGIISRDRLGGLAAGLTAGGGPEASLLSTGIVDAEGLAELLAEYSGAGKGAFPVNYEETARFFCEVPKAMFESSGGVVFGYSGNEASVMVSRLSSAARVKRILEQAGIKSSIYFTTDSNIASLAAERSVSSEHDMEKIREMVYSESASVPLVDISDRQESGELRIASLSAEERPVVRLLNTIVYNAIERNASDIHFEAYGRSAKVKYRIDGVLVETMKDISASFFASMVSRVKIMSALDISEHRVPQDGRFQVGFEGKRIDFRVSVLPSIFGETAVIRILNQQSVKLDLVELGLVGEDLRKFTSAISRPYGMVLVAGPTGSGKTTTLYAAIKSIARIEDKIITIEDPVEYQMDDVVQVPVNEKKGLTFSRGLRSIVRQDPDKIMVGEIRDPETAAISVNAALTGHMVFSTIHANNVIDTISRLLNLGIEPYQFAASFNLIAAQRLVRKICPACRKNDAAAEKYSTELNPAQAFTGTGCASCSGTGFKGRTAVFEILEMNDAVRQMIIDRVSPLKIRDYAIHHGMRTLRRAAMEKVASGVTSISEIDRVTFEEGGR